MTQFQQIRSLIFAIAMILAAAVMIIDPEKGYSYVVTILGIYLLINGINTIIYFATMARHMIGGKLVLYKAVILTDFGYLTASINRIPKVYVLMYLAAIHAFAGAVMVLSAFEKRQNAAHWRLKLIHGMVDIILSLCCIIFIKKPNTAVFIYAFGLIYSATMRIASVLRANEI